MFPHTAPLRRRGVVLVAVLVVGGVAAAGQVGTRARPAIRIVPLPGLAPQALLLDAYTDRAVVLSLRGAGGGVTIVDTTAGRMIRNLAVPEPVDAVALSRGRLLVAYAMPAGSERVLVLDTRRGAVVRALSVGPAFPQSVGADALAIDDAGRQAAVLNPTDSTLRLLDLGTAQVSRAFRVGRGADAVAVDGRAGRVFVLERDRGRVGLFDLVTGARVRAIAVGRGPGRIVVDEAAGRALVSNLDDGTVSVLDTRAGSVVGTVPAGGGPVMIDARSGRAFVSDTSVPGSVTMLDVRRGVALRVIAAGNLPGQSVVDARTGRVFIPVTFGNNSDTVVTAFDLHDGRPVGAAYLGLTDGAAGLMPGTAGTLAVDVARGRLDGVAVGPTGANGQAVGAGALRRIDTRTGAVMRSTPVGANPLAVAVDGRDGQVVVVDAGGSAPRSDPWAPLRRALARWLPAPVSQGAQLVPGDVRIVDDP
jgi:YVTN family beta-propeller protein